MSTTIMAAMWPMMRFEARQRARHVAVLEGVLVVVMPKIAAITVDAAFAACQGRATTDGKSVTTPRSRLRVRTVRPSRCSTDRS